VPSGIPAIEASHGRASSAAAIRIACAVVGVVALALGLVGLVVPVLPTTPFLLLAAACFARSSDRLYRWLLGQPALGSIIVTWQRSRALPPGVRRRALIAVAVTFGISIVLVDAWLLRIGLAILGATVAILLSRIPTAEPVAEPELAGDEV
jgi:uncharacterized membrane protein YbaN (DUF454 family)